MTHAQRLITSHAAKETCSNKDQRVKYRSKISTKPSDDMKVNRIGELARGRLEVILKEKEGSFLRLFTKKYVSVKQVTNQYKESFSKLDADNRIPHS